MRPGAKVGLGVLLVAGIGAVTFGLLTWTASPPPVEPPASAGLVLDRPPTPPPAPIQPAPDEDLPEQPQEPAPLAGLQPDPTRSQPRPPGPKQPEPAEASAPPDTGPPQLKVLAPRGHAVVMTPKLLVRVKSEAGATLMADGRPLAEHTPGLFAADLQLSPGRNQIAIQATDPAGNQASAMVLATFVDPDRFRQNKERFLSLMVQLDEIQVAAADLDPRIAELVAGLSDPAQADRVSLLSQELRGIRNARRQLEQEVARAIAEIDALLAQGP